jgi:hypothetical protein
MIPKCDATATRNKRNLHLISHYFPFRRPFSRKNVRECTRSMYQVIKKYSFCFQNLEKRHDVMFPKCDVIAGGRQVGLARHYLRFHC